MADRAVRVIAPAVLALFAGLGVAMGERPLPLGLAVAAGIAAIAVGSAWRDLRGWPLAAVMLVATAGLIVLGHGGSANLVWMGFCVVAGWVALASALPVALTTGGLLVAGILGEWTQDTEEPGWAAWIVGTTFTLVACTFARRLRETVVQLEAAQHQLAERSRAEERSRIAGEVHDVIGHALTISLLHISSARLALEEDPDEARRALEEAERLARSSLEEVRATVGLMRTDAARDAVPLPGTADIPELVESFRRAGVEVDLDLRGGVGLLGPSRGLIAFRIVQEALTNAAKHAPGEPISVFVAEDEDRMMVRVFNGGVPAGEVAPGTGIRGLQERITAIGGEFLAGPFDEGWLVKARMAK